MSLKGLLVLGALWQIVACDSATDCQICMRKVNKYGEVVSYTTTILPVHPTIFDVENLGLKY